MNYIDELMQNYKKAVYEKDVNFFSSIYDERICVFDMWGKWSYQGIEAWRGVIEDWFGSLGTEKVVVDFDEVQIKINQSQGFATAFVKFTAVSPEGTNLHSMQNRLTWIVEEKKGLWKVIHEHSSAPVDFNTMKATLQR